MSLYEWESRVAEGRLASQGKLKKGRKLPQLAKHLQPFSSNPLDYPPSMSGYEIESLVAEAVLAAEKKKMKQPKTPKHMGRHGIPMVDGNRRLQY